MESKTMLMAYFEQSHADKGTWRSRSMTPPNLERSFLEGRNYQPSRVQSQALYSSPVNICCAVPPSAAERYPASITEMHANPSRRVGPNGFRSLRYRFTYDATSRL